MVLGVVASLRGALKWTIDVVETASFPLFVVGVMAGIAD
jgi:hypothetical protein